MARNAADESAAAPPDVRCEIGNLARVRAQLSERPPWFRGCLTRAIAALDRGEDLATAGWSAADPVRSAAEIEALAGMRRLSSTRKDTK